MGLYKTIIIGLSVERISTTDMYTKFVGIGPIVFYRFCILHKRIGV